MEKININLIPQEFITEKKLLARRSLFIRISIIVVMFGLILTSATLLLRLAQSQKLHSVEQELSEQKSTVTSLSETEGSIIMLKNRLDKINKISSNISIPVSAYDLVNSIVPSGTLIRSFAMSKDTQISLSVETTNTTTLDQLFSNLLDPKINQGQITAVSLENIRLESGKISVQMALDYNLKGSTPPKPKS